MNVATTRTPAPGKTARKAKAPRILLFGDSHSHAVQRAIDKRQGKGEPVPLSAYRLLKDKNGRQIGDLSFEDFLGVIGRLGRDDIVLSMIGGNQHAVFSTIQHPQPFDFFGPTRNPAAEDSVEIVPYRALQGIFGRGLRKGDGKSLEALRAATIARVVHIIPPPPKQDNDHIQEHHETLFAANDLVNRGVSSPALRLKFWHLQTHILEGLCAEFGIEVMMPPARAVDEAGFLRAEFFARDATHANWRYGEWILREIERQYLSPGPLATRAQS
jgi:hypothetical protein